MARVLYGGVGLQGLSGSINKQAGGHTFTKNNVVRRRVVPANPQTALQQEYRGAFAYLTGAWSNTLTDPQREAWETARNSNEYYLKQDPLTGVSRKYGSAKDLFIAMNLNFLIADGAVAAPVVTYTTPGSPGALDVLAITSFALDASAGTAILTYTGTQSNETMVMKATPPVSAGTMRATSVRSKFRVVGVPGNSPAALGTQYTALFGPITGATGQKVFWTVEAVELTTGKSRLVNAGVSVIVA